MTFTPLLKLFVPGVPRPGGSKTATVIRGKGGAIVMKDGRPLVTTREAGKHTAEWRQTVAYSARQEYRSEPARDVLRIDVHFTMPRPKGHYRTGKHAGTLRPGAPIFHTSKPDATKLMRALEDALTGIVWADDALISIQHVVKVYGPTPGATVEVFTIDGPANETPYITAPRTGGCLPARHESHQETPGAPNGEARRGEPPAQKTVEEFLAGFAVGGAAR